MERWIDEACDRLSAAGFVVSRDVAWQSRTFKAVARRTRFEFTKFGMSETFFIFSEFREVGAGTIRDFSADAFQAAKSLRKCFLPCGFFESVWSYAVAVSDRVSESAESIRSEAPPKHWAAAEIPVIYDSGRDELLYFEKTPLWGAAYYAGFRKEIKRYLEGK